MSLTRNTLANYLGRGWEALMGLAFVPLYIRYLGMEAWGLVGFMAMLQAWLSMLDMGLTPTLNREMARFQAGAHSAQSIRDLLHSLEIIYGGIALAVVLVVWVVAPWVAQYWLSAERLPAATVSQAIAVMGVVLAARMAELVYRGAIQGLQHMVWLNSALALLATLRWAGVLGILVWVETSIGAFFLWQGVVSMASLLVLARQTYRYLPKASRPARFDVEAMRAIRRFAGGMAAITLLALLLTQVDKLLLSKLVSLTDFGIYTLAATVAGALSFLVTPMATAVSPRLTELVARADEYALAATYHRASQWVAVLLIPPALVMAAFAEPLLWAWTGDHALAQRTAPLLALLALGTMCNCFMQVPYMAQLAHGWTGLAVRTNVIAVALIVPAIAWAVPRYGAIGAAWVWLALNVGYMLIPIHFMHRKILRGEKWRWYGREVALPLGVCGLLVLLFRMYIPFPVGRLQAATLLITLSSGCALLLHATNSNRKWHLCGR
jgi:O-antigen/teichoic acid export membrane protein